MPGFSNVDDDPDPDRLVRLLDEVADAELGIKRYAVTAHAQRRQPALVLDLGCGAGHDLALFAELRLPAIGLDASATMLRTARDRNCERLVQGNGHRLPFATATFTGCRIDRVLQHTLDPDAVLGEVARVVSPGGCLTVFEPDYSRYEAGWMSSARQPDIGGRLWSLVERAGFRVEDRVEELSVHRSLDVPPGSSVCRAPSTQQWSTAASTARSPTHGSRRRAIASGPARS